MIDNKALGWIILALYASDVAICIAAVCHRDDDTPRPLGGNPSSAHVVITAQLANVSPSLIRNSSRRYAQLRNYSPFQSGQGRFLVFGLVLILAATALTFLDLD